MRTSVKCKSKVILSDFGQVAPSSSRVHCNRKIRYWCFTVFVTNDGNAQSTTAPLSILVLVKLKEKLKDELAERQNLISADKTEQMNDFVDCANLESVMKKVCHYY